MPIFSSSKMWQVLLGYKVPRTTNIFDMTSDEMHKLDCPCKDKELQLPCHLIIAGEEVVSGHSEEQ